MEHNSMSIDLAAQISIAAQDAGITPVVRVPDFQHFHATRALDAGAQGIVVPHVDNPEVARRMVRHCMYPPIGHRSVTGALPQLDLRPAPLGEATAAINAATLLILMIETPEAIDRVEEIAAVPGFDVLLVGANDLCMEMGIPGQLDHPRLGEAFERTVAASRANGKHAGLGGVYDPPLIQRYLAMGFRLVLAGSDLSFMLGAAKARASAVRAMKLG
jgi:2-keto-3-deoxy-L-rhamnonate aldolase RhmA